MKKGQSLHGRVD
jgi:hypothetical protein